MMPYKIELDFTGKIVVITGAAGILGAEFCKAFASLGAQVICLDSDLEKLSTMTSVFQKEFEKSCIDFFPCDVSNKDDVESVISQVIKRYQKIDVLINNAATKSRNLKSFFEKFEDYSLDTWKEIMSVNLDGMFLMAQAVGRQMRLQKNGAIIQTGSIYSLLGADQRIYQGSHYLGGEINTPAVYTASKAGVIGLTKHLAALWGSDNIRVNAICPGGVESGQNEEFKNKYINRIPLGRMADKKDIVGPMVFLASDVASYITGQVLFVDGGLSAW
jgi:NAD(P)-dependent dehydrogenase (short-subunit alcohol dehydrogenase family)